MCVCVREREHAHKFGELHSHLHILVEHGNNTCGHDGNGSVRVTI
jgi:hypothetical protein